MLEEYTDVQGRVALQCLHNDCEVTLSKQRDRCAAFNCSERKEGCRNKFEVKSTRSLHERVLLTVAVQEQQYLPAPDWQFAPPTSLSEPASCHTSSAIYTHNAGRIVCVQLSIEYNLIKGETSYASILYG